MAVDTQSTTRVWRGGAPWTRSAVDGTPRAWLILYLHAEAEPMRPTTVQHLRFLEHSLTPHDVLLWNAAHGVPRWVRDGRHWPTLYPRTSARTRMERSYTGFVDDRAAGAVETLPRPHTARTLDIVYRARNLPFHIGHHGQLKHRIAEIVDPAARAHGLRTDISTRIADTKYGDAWFEFLAGGRC